MSSRTHLLRDAGGHATRLRAQTLAALQRHPAAGHQDQQEQQDLLAGVRRSWNDLVFGVLCRAGALSGAAWEQLDAECAAVSRAVRELSDGVADPCRRAALHDLARHVEFARALGAGVRGAGDHERAELPDAARLLDVRRLQQLYDEELRVVKDWSVLDDDSVECTVELLALDGAEGWHAPWYVAADGPAYRPVNVRGEELREVAKDDAIRSDRPLPTHPRSLRHGSLPAGLRLDGTAAVEPLLDGPVPTASVLVYELAGEPAGELVQDGPPEPLVLDGNHRLAAAARSQRAGRFPVPRVLAFRIRERRPVDRVTTTGSRDGERWTWAGFTPDVALLRHGRLLPD